MKKISSFVDKKVKGIMWNLIGNGIFLLILGVLIVWTTFTLRLLIGLFVIVVGYVFLYGAYKIWLIRQELKKYLKI